MEQDIFVIKGWVKCEHHDAEGRLVWVDEGPNGVVTEGVNFIWNNDLQATPIYIGLIGAPSNLSAVIASNWTMAQVGGNGSLYETPSHFDGMREIYHQYTGDRKLWVVPLATAASLTNAASPAVFTFANSITAYGAFLTTFETKNTVTGTLIAAKHFSSAKVITAPGTLTVTYVLSGGY